MYNYYDKEAHPSGETLSDSVHVHRPHTKARKVKTCMKVSVIFDGTTHAYI